MKWFAHPLPFVPFDEDWKPDGEIPAYVGLYRASRQRFLEEAARAAIPVHQIRGLVLVAGGDDQVWPAVEMARVIEARRAAYGLTTAVVTDAEAGHRALLPGEPVVGSGITMRRGGSEQADRRLGQAAWREIAALL